MNKKLNREDLFRVKLIVGRVIMNLEKEVVTIEDLDFIIDHLSVLRRGLLGEEEYDKMTKNVYCKNLILKEHANKYLKL